MKILFSLLILFSFKLSFGASKEIDKKFVDDITKGLAALDTVANGPQIDCNNHGKVVDPNQQKVPVSVLSPADLKKAFDYVAGQKYIPFAYAKDGCYARAHEMAKLLENKGVITGKVFLESKSPEHPLVVNSPKAGRIQWWYHVAPIVNVKTSKGTETYVIDPSLFHQAVPLKEWVRIQTEESKADARYFFTKRFNFQPDDEKVELQSYRQDDIDKTDKTLMIYQAHVEMNDYN
jgi:hypothetical protein